MATGSSKRRKRREKRAAAARADGSGADDQSGGFGCLESGTPVANVGEVAALALEGTFAAILEGQARSS